MNLTVQLLADEYETEKMLHAQVNSRYVEFTEMNAAASLSAKALRSMISGRLPL